MLRSFCSASKPLENKKRGHAEEFLLSISRFRFRKGRTLVSVLNKGNKGDPELQHLRMTASKKTA